MAFIDKSDIIEGGITHADHLHRIIDALSAISGSDISISGSVNVTGSIIGAFTGSYSGSITSASFAETASYVSGKLDALISFNFQSSSYTLQATDAPLMVVYNNTGSANFIFPSSSVTDFPTGSQFLFFQSGSGQINFITGSTSMSLYSNGGKVKSSTTYSMATAIVLRRDVWVLSGDISTT